MSEPDDLEAQLPPLVGRVRANLRGEQIIFTLPNGQELAYNREEADFIYTMLYQHGRYLWPGPDVNVNFQLVVVHCSSEITLTSSCASLWPFPGSCTRSS